MAGQTVSITPGKSGTGFALALQHPRFVVLWLSEALSLIGDRLIMVALITLVYDRTHSAGAVGLLLMLKAIPALVLGSVAGVFVDRWDRKWIMVVSNLLQGVFVLLIPALPGIAIVFVAYLAMSVVNQFFIPARSATIPDLVSAEALMPANSLFAISFVGAMAVGPAIGTWVTERFGLNAAFYADAATFLVPAVAVGLLTISRQRRDLAGSSPGADLREGFAFVRSHPAVFAALILITVAFLVIGTLSVTGVVIMRENLKVEASKVGVLMSALGVGMLSGAVAANQLGRRFNRLYLGAAGAGLMSLGLAALSWAPSLPVALVFAVIIGLGMITVQVSCQTILQTASETLRGRLTGMAQALMGSATFLASALAGLLTERLGVTAILSGVGILALAAAVAATASNHRR
jgi:predicted MFS family arabinose efflux permease